MPHTVDPGQVSSQKCPDCGSTLKFRDGFYWCENPDCNFDDIPEEEDPE